MFTIDDTNQWRIQDLVKGQMRESGGTSVQQPWAEPQPLAYFCFLKAHFERFEALQVLHFNVHCVCYNQKLTIILFIQKCSQ